jgi:hypothetical protein
LRTLTIPGHGHQRPKTSCVIVMMVRNKNSSDLSNINACVRKAASNTVTGINDVMCSVDG